MIYITGAGCGDCSLLTLKARHVLEEADCVLYDRLIDDSVLRFVKQDCEMIYVGKENHVHTLPQSKINELLVAKGKQYQHVVRLKGGDPYVFGRGSEEALYLNDHQMMFEVIPGISSAFAAGTYAGIPVTHRACSLGVHVISAHSMQDTMPPLDFHALATSKDTLVFLMGLQNLKLIVHGLLQEGMSTDTKIALISHAASASQEVFVSTLANVLHESHAVITSPTLIIVGETIAMQEQLSFYMQKPLYHKSYVMVSMHYDEDVYWQFEEQGASINIIKCGHMEENRNALDDIDVNLYKHILFTSRQGIDAFFHLLFEKGLDARDLAHTKLCVIGDKTANHLHCYGCRADIISKGIDSTHFGAEMLEEVTINDHVLLAQAIQTNHVLSDMLKKRCHVKEVGLYRNVADPFVYSDVRQDGILFTSSFCVDSFMQQMKDYKNMVDITMYAIGTQTKKALKAYGVKKIIMLTKPDKGLFIEAVMKEEQHVSR